MATLATSEAATTVCPRVLSKITSGGAVAVGCVSVLKDSAVKPGTMVFY